MFKLDGVRETEGDPEGDFGLEPSGEELGLVGALAVNLHHVELFVVAVVKGFHRGFKDEAEPAELGAADALHAEQVKGDAEGGVGVVGVVGAVAELKLQEVKQGGLAGGTSDGDDAGTPAPEGEVGEKTEVAGGDEIKTFFEFGDKSHSLIIT